MLSSVCMWCQPAVKPRHAVFFLIVLVPVLAFTGTVSAQSSVSWDTRAVYHGTSARVVIEALLPPDDPAGGAWRMYALDSPRPSRALSVRIDTLPAGLVAEDSLRQLDAQSGYNPYFEKTVTYFKGQALVWADYSVESSFSGGAAEGSVEFTICNERICLPPDSASIMATFAEASLPLGAFPTASSFPSSSKTPLEIQDLPPSDMEDDASRGIWGFMLLAIGSGLGALLMPCIYPMIPLTVSYFSHHAGNTPIRMALLYGLAIVATFTGLGTGLSIIVGSAGAQIVASSPWVNLGIAIAFFAFGLSLLGLFTLRLPSFLVNWFDRKGKERQDYMGVLFMGLALTLVSFTCTVPFVGLLLPGIASGAWFYGILGMAMFSLTFALPFVAFACFPQALKVLPGGGGWMQKIAVVFGFIEIAAAIKFFSNADLVWGLGLIDRPLVIALWIVLATLTGIYLIGHLRLLPNTETAHVGAGRLLFGVLFFGIAVYLLPGLFGGRLGKLDAYLPPRDANTASLFGVEVQQDWIIDDLPGAFSEAVHLDRPLFIDFSGYTCTNCREMEVNVFERGEVSRLLADHFVLSRLYTDGPKSRQFQDFQENLTGTLALPTYAILDGAETDRPLVQLSGVVSSEEFESFLQQGLQEYED